MAATERVSAFQGDIHLDHRDNRAYLVLDLAFPYGRPDSLRIVLGEPDHALALRRAGHHPAVLDTVLALGDPNSPLRWTGVFQRRGALRINDVVGDQYRLSGELEVPLLGRPDPSRVEISGWLAHDREKNTTWKASRLLVPHTLAFTLIPFISYGAYDARLPGTDQRDGMLGSLGGAVDLWWARERLSVFSDVRLNYSNDNPFTFQEAIGLRWRHHFRHPSADWRPALEIGGAYTSITNQRGESRYKDAEWGGHAGVSLIGPWENLTYRYSTALGGYHTVAADVWAHTTGVTRFGTRYEYCDGEGFQTIRVAMVLEGLGAASDDLLRRDTRPLVHKILAYASMLPLAPIALLTLVFPGV